MTIHLWDASHYDGTLTKAILVKAKAEGIVGFTHKLGEGASHNDDDHTQSTALAAARDAGIPVIGGYWFGHNDDDPIVTANLCVQVADQYEPWWRTFPGWFWQADCETETGHGKPTRDWIQKFSDELVRRTSRKVIVYASHGQYGDSLTGLTHPLWNANYPSSRQAPFKNLYPGDSYAGWSKYSGQTPIICQYTSSATIAGRTTCDANAFRGTIAELLALIAPNTEPTTQPTEVDMPLTSEDIAAIWAYKLPAGETARGALQDAALRTGTIANTQMPAISAALTALQTGLTPAAITAAMKAAFPTGLPANLTAEAIGEALHAELVADAQKTAAALASGS